MKRITTVILAAISLAAPAEAEKLGKDTVLEVYAIDLVYGSEKRVGLATAISDSGRYVTLSKLLGVKGFEYYLRAEDGLLHGFKLVAKSDDGLAVVQIDRPNPALATLSPANPTDKIPSPPFIATGFSKLIEAPSATLPAPANCGDFTKAIPEGISVSGYDMGQDSVLHQAIGPVLGDAGAAVIAGGKIYAITEPVAAEGNIRLHPIAELGCMTWN
jgi:hypothetical protein